MTEDERIRVMIVDDHSLVRYGVTVGLRTFDDFTVIAEAGNGREALEKMRQTSAACRANGCDHAGDGWDRDHPASSGTSIQRRRW